MALTEKEKIAWLADKRRREQRELRPRRRPEPTSECVICQHPIGIGEGALTDKLVICDICNGD